VVSEDKVASNGAVDRGAHRYDDEGNLTVWGAREVLLELVGSRSFVGPHHAAVCEALDDLEDAVLRTHDDFGCFVGGLGVDGNDEPRFVCRACRTRSQVKVMPALRVAETRMRATIREALEDAYEGDVLHEDTLAFVAVRVCEAVGYELLARAQEDDEESQAFRDAVIRRRRLLAEEEPACYDGLETADQNDQTAAEDVTVDGSGRPVGWRSLSLRDALVVREGDVVNMKLRTNAAGELVIGELEVIRGGSRDGDA